MKNKKGIISKSLILFTMAISSSKLMADEKDLYDFMWLDPDKKVYVLQNKVHKKDKSVYANLGYGMDLSSNFQDTSGLHANLGFNFTEEWAIEALYTKYSNSDNDDVENLRRINGVTPFIRKMESNYGVLVKWSPFYGKINTFNKIFYFDWSFGAGLGQIKTASNRETVSNPLVSNQYKTESYTSLILKTGLQFHATKNIHVGVDLLVNNYKAPGPTINSVEPKEKMRTNMDAIFTIGLSY